MKVFALSLNGVVVSGQVATLLGLPLHRRQARVLVAAPSRASAFGFVSAMPDVSIPARADPEFRAALGNDVDTLVAAGQLARLRVLAFDGDAARSPVVEVRVDGAHLLVGWLARAGFVDFRFEPADGS